MTPETMIAGEEQQDSSTQQRPAEQHKSVHKGVEGEAKPTREAANKDTQTPPAAKSDATRTDKFVFGIPQDGLTEKERQVPVDEPPPLPQNSELTYIGKPTTRWDGPQKAMGRGKYTADMQLPGMLYAQMVGASVAHGRITSIDTSAAEKLPGVKAVHVIEHTYGIAELRDPSKEAPSKYPVIRYAGQPIGHVATNCGGRSGADQGDVR
jgi:xanthine dehydrogenase YagR molybdenum-binding subunit